MPLTTTAYTILHRCLSVMTSLKTLNISDNHIKEIPSSLMELPRLEMLSAANNLIDSLPVSRVLLKTCSYDITVIYILMECTFPSCFNCYCKYNKYVMAVSLKPLSFHQAECASLHAMELDLNRNRLAFLPSSLARAPRLRVLRVAEVLQESGVG